MELHGHGGFQLEGDDTWVLGEGGLQSVPGSGRLSAGKSDSCCHLVQGVLDCDGRRDICEDDCGVSSVVQPYQLYLIRPDQFLAQSSQLSFAEHEEESRFDDGQTATGICWRTHQLDIFVHRKCFPSNRLHNELESIRLALCSLLGQNGMELFCVGCRLEDYSCKSLFPLIIESETDASQWSFSHGIADILDCEGLGKVEKEDDSNLVNHALSIIPAGEYLRDATHWLESRNIVVFAWMQVDKLSIWVRSVGNGCP